MRGFFAALRMTALILCVSGDGVLVVGRGAGRGIAWPFSFVGYGADGRISGGLHMPVIDLLEGLGEGVDDQSGSSIAEALDGEVGGLLRIVGSVPETDDDAVVGQVQADALADGAGLGEGEGREGRDEDDGVGFVGERFEDLG